MRKITLIILLLSFTIILSGCKKEPEVIDNTKNLPKIEKLTADKSCQGQTGQKACPKSGEEIAVMETTYGTIKIKFFENDAPKTVANFKKLTNEGFYNGLIFHRIIENFMIQGGDPKGTGEGGPDYVIPAEISKGLKHLAGTVATARLSDDQNPKKDSSGSQFYIVHTDTGASNLDGDYTIFGQVVEGQNVVDAIAKAETEGGRGQFANRPVREIRIEKVYLEKY